MPKEDKNATANSSSDSSQDSRYVILSRDGGSVPVDSAFAEVLKSAGTEITMTPEMFRAFGLDPAPSSDRADTAAKFKDNGGHSSKAASNETERDAEGSNR
ncbi:hypothetical protein V865_008527 [Kwoniella europaea PYCC6329]|uniref:Uncharacterized protein n=1 Tax=Kwoniella europaea PYCC6329 TaxID=1423913 RepID=A0AAX4KVX1_9TREE